MDFIQDPATLEAVYGPADDSSGVECTLPVVDVQSVRLSGSGPLSRAALRADVLGADPVST